MDTTDDNENPSLLEDLMELTKYILGDENGDSPEDGEPDSYETLEPEEFMSGAVDPYSSWGPVPAHAYSGWGPVPAHGHMGMHVYPAVKSERAPPPSPVSSAADEQESRAAKKRKTETPAVAVKDEPDIKVATPKRTRPANLHDLQQLEMQLEKEPDKNKKAAIQAKINREKKKLQASTLEDQVEKLTKENFNLKRRNSELEESHSALSTEVQYLRNILANQSTLSNLLQNIPHTNGVRLSTSFNVSPSDVQTIARLSHATSLPETPPPAGVLTPPQSGVLSPSHAVTATAPQVGVCLHVNNHDVSLEFCSKCSQSSSTS